MNPFVHNSTQLSVATQRRYEETHQRNVGQTVRVIRGQKANYGSDVDRLTAQTLNDHYAAISTDSEYTAPILKSTAPAASLFISEITVFRMLDQLRPMATGLDAVPAWFLHLGAPVFAAPIAKLFNQSLIAGVVPHQWKAAIITPVPKIPGQCN